ncbi:unnamed protein product [Caenorhabditis sp. 36 PRJEB53466]|nr:unnamed protein product [Caenorhabditis sp. 36 PRJEB53466]
MHVRKLTNVLLGVTCALCIFTAFLVFIVALIYMSIFVFSSNGKGAGGCSRGDQSRGMECAPRIEELSLALEELEPGYANPGRFKEIANFCNITLECVAPIKCKSITKEYEFVKASCAVFELASNDITLCLKRLQKRFLHGTQSCIHQIFSSPNENNNEIMCHVYRANRECSESEIRQTCGEELVDKYEELLDRIMELFNCQQTN